jgi:beta-lactam-binding protein with PASTA domain
VVVFSYPKGGSELPMGSTVNLMVNRGRATNYAYMPKVIGLTLDEAIQLIEDKGLKVGTVRHRFDRDLLPETVMEQSEPEGAELELGTAIDLVVSET